MGKKISKKTNYQNLEDDTPKNTKYSYSVIYSNSPSLLHLLDDKLIIEQKDESKIFKYTDIMSWRNFDEMWLFQTSDKVLHVFGTQESIMISNRIFELTTILAKKMDDLRNSIIV